MRAFLAVCTQWRWLAPGDGTLRLAGLDYAAARAGFDLAGIAMTPDLWSQVQIIELGARAASQGGAEA